MAKQMYATLLIVTNLEGAPLPAALLNVLKIEAHNLAKPGERIDRGAVKPDANLSVGWVEFPHHKLNVAPMVTKSILAHEVTKRVNPGEMEKWTTGDDGCDLLESLKLRNLDVLGVG